MPKTAIIRLLLLTHVGFLSTLASRPSLIRVRVVLIAKLRAHVGAQLSVDSRHRILASLHEFGIGTRPNHEAHLKG